MSENLLEVRNLRKHFPIRAGVFSRVSDFVKAVDDVSFVGRPHEITAIIGPNGAGKTTVFNCITGFYKPTVGKLTLHGDREYLLERMLGPCCHAAAHRDDEDVLVVAHGGVISVYACTLLGCSFNQLWRLRVDNASFTIVKPPRLVRLNDTAHLEGNLRPAVPPRVAIAPQIAAT